MPGSNSARETLSTTARPARPPGPGPGTVPCAERLESRALLSGTGPAGSTPAPKDLLFFGNSFTRYNNLPQLVRSIAAAARHPAPNVVTQVAEGMDLAYHVGAVRAAWPNSVIDAVPPGGWEAVVVQGHSLEPTRVGDATGFRARAAELVGRVRGHSPAAAAVLYQTWARGPLSPVYPASFGGPADMHADLRAAYAAARSDIASTSGGGGAAAAPPTAVAPAGEAFRALGWRPDLYDGDDQYHPSPRGSLLAALTIFTAAYDDDAADVPAAAVADALAARGLTAADWDELTRVADAQRVTAAVASATVPEGGAVALTSGAWSAAVDRPVVRYEWDLNYDGVTFDPTPGATGPAPMFAAAGLDGPATRTVGLRVTDSAGAVSRVATAAVRVTNANPTAAFAVTAAGPGGAVAAAFPAAIDPSPADAAAGFRYSFDFNNDGDFADPGDVSGSTSPAASHAFGAAGTYAVRGRVADRDGGYTDYTAAVTVAQPPAPPVPPSPPATTTLAVRAAADAYGLNGPAANTNYGTSGELQVRLSSVSGHHREAFLRFDLSQVASADRITSAAVRLTGRLSQAGGVNVGLFPVTGGTNWTEPGLTWNNKPASGTAAIGALRTMSNTANAAVEFDVTNYLKQQKQAGATVVNLAMKAANYTTPFVIFASDEATAGRPELRVAQQTGGPVSPPVVPPPPPTSPGKLAGRLIGTAGSYGNNPSLTAAKAVDGNLATYFDAAAANGAWVGLDLGSARRVTAVAFAPRSGFGHRMVGGRFQASNAADFSAGVVTLHTVAAAPASGKLTTVAVNPAGGTFRYVRFLSPNGGYGNIAEAQFFGV